MHPLKMPSQSIGKSSGSSGCSAGSCRTTSGAVVAVVVVVAEDGAEALLAESRLRQWTRSSLTYPPQLILPHSVPYGFHSK